MSESALYFGRVVHHRLLPRAHRFRYGVMSMFLDLDDIDRLAAGCRLFSRNRFNLYAFYDRDHGAPDGGALQEQIRQRLATAGLDLTGGRICLLCYPRILGYVFNPLSLYYCYDSQERLRALIYEVNNTFGQRHSYLIPVDGDSTPIRQSVDKVFYVSPFMPMDCRYHFRVLPPGAGIGLHIELTHGNRCLFRAGFGGNRQPFDDRNLLRACLRYPLMTFKVIAGIHVEALRLWFKGLKLQPRPKPPADPVTLGGTGATPAAVSRHPGDGERRDET